MLTSEYVAINLLELECDRVRLELMKAGLVIREFHDLETHLNRIRDFTGSLCRISSNTSYGRYSNIPYLSFFFSALPISDCWENLQFEALVELLWNCGMPQTIRASPPTG